jgi:hypothetical protein
MDNQITLCFNNPFEPILNRIDFRSRFLSKNRLSVRGKTAWALNSTGSFEWTSAVRGLVSLLLNDRLNREQRIPQELDKSLAYALAKKPIWIKELFGLEECPPLVARIFKTSRNIESSTCVSINNDFLQSSNIHVLMDGCELTSPVEIAALANSLNKAGSYGVRTESLNLLEQGIQQELKWGLAETDILTKEGRSGFVKYLANLQLTSKLSGRKVCSDIVNLEDRPLSSTSSNELTKQLLDLPSYTMEVPVIAATAAAIVLKMKGLGATLKVSYKYPTSYWLVKDLLQGKVTDLPDLIGIGIVPLMNLMNSEVGKSYELLTPLGLQSSWLVPSKQKQSAGLTFFREEPSNLLLDAEKLGHSTDRNNSLENPKVLKSARLSELNDNALIFSPFAPLVRSFGYAVRPVQLGAYSGNSFYLLARKGKLNKHSMNLMKEVVHRAWYSLLFEKNAPKKYSNLLMADSDFTLPLVTEAGLI